MNRSGHRFRPLALAALVAGGMFLTTAAPAGETSKPSGLKRLTPPDGTMLPRFEMAPVDATYPPPGGDGPSASTSFSATPPGDDEPGDGPGERPADPPPRDTGGTGANQGGGSTRPSGASLRPEPVPAAPAAPAPAPRPPASTGSLLGSAIPRLDPALPAADDDPGTAVDADIEPGQVIFMTADVDGAQRVATSIAAEGYRVRSRSTLPGMRLVLSVASLPPGVDEAAAAAALRSRFPDIVVDTNHRYRLQAAGRSYAAEMIGWDAASPCLSAVPIGMIDTPVDAADAALASARVTTVEILPAGLARPDTAHGTAIAAILAGGEQGNFTGLHAGGEVVAVNVFRRVDGERVDSTAAWIVRGFDALAQRGVAVINVSLGGGANRVLELAVRTLLADGIALVAAAGNGGRDARPVYPAAYPGVIAVTALDADGRVFRQASRGDYVDFAAPGVDVYIPTGGGGYVSGTSFAAPFISAAVAAVRGRRADLSPRAVTEYLASLSRDLGDAGRDAVYGFGLPDLSGHCSAIARLD